MIFCAETLKLLIGRNRTPGKDFLMLSIVKKVVLLIVIFAWAQVFADDTVLPETASRIQQSIQQARPDLQIGDVSTTPISGIYKVVVNNNQFLYASEDGKYLIVGDIYEVRPGYLSEVQDPQEKTRRREQLAAVPDEEFLIFPAEGEVKKAVVYVFTDIDCGFCRKLHLGTVPGLNKAGVEVRYLAFPRAGLDSESFRKIATAWCAEDRREALTLLKKGESLKENVCADNPIAKQYQMGVDIGVRGTPALVLADGSLLPGYRTAEELLAILGVQP